MIELYDRTKYVTVSEAGTLLNMNGKNTQWMRGKLAAFGIQPVSAYIHKGEPQALYDRNAVMNKAQEMKPKEQPAPPPPAVVAQPAAQPIALIDRVAMIELKTKIDKLTEALVDPPSGHAVNLAPVIDRLEQLLRRPSTPLTEMQTLRDIVSAMQRVMGEVAALNNSVATMNRKFDDMMKGMHALTIMQNDILKAITEPQT